MSGGMRGDQEEGRKGVYNNIQDMDWLLGACGCLFKACSMY